MKSHKDLTVWQKSMDLVELVYKITDKLPKSEVFGLSSQMQRAAVAIPSNIAEGAKRGHRLEYIQFLRVANGSAAELETQLILTEKLYPEEKNNIQKANLLLEEILKMLYALIAVLKR
ncbi:MAG: four helix bundle protein [Candidatus Daviesbacteria bacterium]|nr:four helix bundle protein [Candidatus Daviesbacteria bacterium]